ncbi:hypothetical protein FKM82_024785 [Ascaphus truei]
MRMYSIVQADVHTCYCGPLVKAPTRPLFIRCCGPGVANSRCAKATNSSGFPGYPCFSTVKEHSSAQEAQSVAQSSTVGVGDPRGPELASPVVELPVCRLRYNCKNKRMSTAEGMLPEDWGYWEQKEGLSGEKQCLFHWCTPPNRIHTNVNDHGQSNDVSLF